MANGVEMKVRNLFLQRLSREEIVALNVRLADQLGVTASESIQHLVAPKRRDEVAGMNESQIIDAMSRDPGMLRRPIIDIKGQLLLGFAKGAQAQLASSL